MPASKPFSPVVGHTGLALESRVADLRIRLGDLPADILAHHSGASYLDLGPGRGEFHLSLLGLPILITYPDFHALSSNGDPLPAIKQALLFYYFLTSDGSIPSGNWLSFAELPEGRVYATAFQRNTGDLVAKQYNTNLAAFCSTCKTTGGHPLQLGDAGFYFDALPRLPLAVLYHLGDDEFPSTCKMLFDESAPHHLPTEACAILGGMLARKLL